jgi:RNA-binding protein YlmH
MNQGDENLEINTATGKLSFAKEEKSISGDVIFEEQGTFCRVGSELSGILEVDLQSIKQKGVEIRNISFAIPLGVDENENPVKAEMLFMDEKIFEKFKSFIAKLNWND